MKSGWRENLKQKYEKNCGFNWKTTFLKLFFCLQCQRKRREIKAKSILNYSFIRYLYEMIYKTSEN